MDSCFNAVEGSVTYHASLGDLKSRIWYNAAIHTAGYPRDPKHKRIFPSPHGKLPVPKQLFESTHAADAQRQTTIINAAKETLGIATLM